MILGLEIYFFKLSAIEHALTQKSMDDYSQRLVVWLHHTAGQLLGTRGSISRAFMPACDSRLGLGHPLADSHGLGGGR